MFNEAHPPLRRVFSLFNCLNFLLAVAAFIKKSFVLMLFVFLISPYRFAFITKAFPQNLHKFLFHRSLRIEWRYFIWILKYIFLDLLFMKSFFTLIYDFLICKWSVNCMCLVDISFWADFKDHIRKLFRSCLGRLIPPYRSVINR